MVTEGDLKKLDELKERYEQATTRQREHIKADIFDDEDERVYKEAYSAWREQFNKVYGMDQEAQHGEE